MTNRVKPIPVEALQRSDEWFKSRLGKVTASRVADVMAFYKPTLKNLAEASQLYIEQSKPVEETELLRELSPTAYVALSGVKLQEQAVRKSYRETLVAERLSGLPNEPEPYISYDMKWGIASEDIAVTKYQLLYENIVERAPFLLHPTIKAGASPDGFVIDRTTGLLGTIEIKCLRTSNHLYEIIKTDEVPSKYIPQIQMQLWISGRDFCDFIGFDSRVSGGLQIFVRRVIRDDGYINLVLEPLVIHFLEQCDKDEKYFRYKMNEIKKAQL